MKIWIILFVLLSGCTVSKSVADTQKEDMLYPSVKVITETGHGSGVVFMSENGMSMILTAKHVIKGHKTVNISFYPYDDEVKGTVIKRSEEHDLALVAVMYEHPYMVTLGRVRHLKPFEKVWKVGAGNGLPPYPTEGIVSIYDEEMMLVSAPITFGDSGGGLFVKEGKHYVYVGMATMVGATMRGFIPIVIHHQAYGQTLYDIYPFLLEG